MNRQRFFFIKQALGAGTLTLVLHITPVLREQSEQKRDTRSTQHVRTQNGYTWGASDALGTGKCNRDASDRESERLEIVTERRGKQDVDVDRKTNFTL